MRPPDITTGATAREVEPEEAREACGASAPAPATALGGGLKLSTRGRAQPLPMIGSAGLQLT